MIERLHCLISHVAVKLGNQFKGGMHAHYRHTGIDSLNVAICHVLCDGTAAALATILTVTTIISLLIVFRLTKGKVKIV